MKNFLRPADRASESICSPARLSSLPSCCDSRLYSSHLLIDMDPEMFRLFVHNSHCKSIVFGGCHDNGYLPNLESFKRDDSVAPRMTLLESTPAEWQYRNLGFHIARFPSVFRTQPLPERAAVAPVPLPNLSAQANIFSPTATPDKQTNVFSPPASSPLPTPGQPPCQNGMPYPSPASKPTTLAAPNNASRALPASSTYANVGGTSNSKEISIAPAKPPQRQCVYLNQDSKRIDKPIPKPMGVAETRLKMRLNNGKLCNMYHLLNKCKNGAKCQYQHGERLGDGEQLALRIKARTTPCARGSNCLDINCVSGHHCPNPLCDRADCYFEDAHYAGEIAKPRLRVYEDGGIDVIN